MHCREITDCPSAHRSSNQFADELIKCTFFRYTSVLKCNCCLYNLFTAYVQPAIFHLPIFSCWLQVAVGQGFPLFPGPLRLSCANCYASPIRIASPYRTSVQHIPVIYTMLRNPVTVTLICISLKTSRPGLKST